MIRTAKKKSFVSALRICDMVSMVLEVLKEGPIKGIVELLGPGKACNNCSCLVYLQGL